MITESDYVKHILAKQKIKELMAEAEKEALVKEAKKSKSAATKWDKSRATWLTSILTLLGITLGISK